MAPTPVRGPGSIVLSRVAESAFWIGRHVERADGTARFLDVHLRLLLEEPWAEEDRVCRSLLEVVGAPAPAGDLTRADVLTLLAVDRHGPASIAHSLGVARDHARRARDAVPTELWDCLDTTRARMPRKVASEREREFFAWVRERSALAVGIVESATSRDEVWGFFTLGRSLERADLTARILAASGSADGAGPSWGTVLRSCGAHRAFRLAHGAAPNARSAAAFLLLDERFPHAVLFAVRRAAECLQDLGRTDGAPHGADGAMRGSDGATVVVESLRAELESVRVAQALDDLSARTTAVSRATAAASAAIHAQWFATAPAA